MLGLFLSMFDSTFSLIGEYSDNKEMLEFRDLLKYDYYEDDDWLWLNNKKRVNLRDIGESNF